eukprot:4405085-Ditylum_brightwellii.AAC.1
MKGKRVHFISGKFDQLQQARPLSAMNAAFIEYTNSIILQGPKTCLETKKAVINAINTDVGVLTDVFPCLCKIIGKPQTAPIEVGSIAAQNRFKFIFQMFVRAISTPSHPIILFLDDLQWADELSLQLICALEAEMETNNFLFIGSYRDNEVHSSHPLRAYLSELKRKEIDITEINVGCISKEDVNSLISDIFGMPQHLTSRSGTKNHCFFHWIPTLGNGIPML